MAIVFLLGPSEWVQGPPPGDARTPMAHRRDLANILRARGHVVLLMEDEEDRPGEDLVQKFERLLDLGTDVVLYWPLGAKMATTYDEMLLLRKAQERGALPRLWFLHHASVASIRRGTFTIHEQGGRSRYLTALARLGIVPLPWGTRAELHSVTERLALELT